jgi:hypothetical protein
MGNILCGASQEKFAQGRGMGSVMSYDKQLRASVLGLAHYGLSRLTCPQQFGG